MKNLDKEVQNTCTAKAYEIALIFLCSPACIQEESPQIQAQPQAQAAQTRQLEGGSCVHETSGNQSQRL